MLEDQHAELLWEIFVLENNGITYHIFVDCRLIT